MSNRERNPARDLPVLYSRETRLKPAMVPGNPGKCVLRSQTVNRMNSNGSKGHSSIAKSTRYKSTVCNVFRVIPLEKRHLGGLHTQCYEKWLTLARINLANPFR